MIYKKDIIEAINKEIKWCEENPNTAEEAEFEDGFVKGLKQVKHIITSMKHSEI